MSVSLTLDVTKIVLSNITILTSDMLSNQSKSIELEFKDPDMLCEIAENAFVSQKFISLEIPNSLIKLPERCFFQKQVFLTFDEPKLLEIPKECFCACFINNLIIPKSIQIIHIYAFHECVCKK